MWKKHKDAQDDLDEMNAVFEEQEYTDPSAEEEEPKKKKKKKEKRSNGKKAKKLSFRNAAKRNKNLKYGGYSAILTSIILVILIAFNLVVERLNISFDLTVEELYSVSDETMEVLDALESDVYIYGFYETGDEEGTYASMVIDFLERYEALNEHLSFELKDPVSDPAFANQFLVDTTDTITSGNVVVQSEETGRYKILSLSDMLEFTYDSSSDSGYSVSGWDAENAITGAVQYVVSEETPVIYQLSGHGETELTDTMVSYLESSNFGVETLNLIEGDEVSPEDYTTILINNPQTDLTDMEYETLLDYMENGGRMIYLFQYDIPELENFENILERFGMSIVHSGSDYNYIVETNSDNYYSYPQLIIPNRLDYDEDEDDDDDSTKYESDIISGLDDDAQLLFLAAGAIEINENRNRNTDLTALLYTSDDALIKATDNSLLSYQDGDLEGPFNIAVIAKEQEQIGDNVETAELCVIGSSTFIDYDAANGLVTNGNYQFFLNICNFMQDEVSSLYIPAKTFSTENLVTSMTTAMTGFVIFVILIPLLIIGCGVFVWFRRKSL